MPSPKRCPSPKAAASPKKRPAANAPGSPVCAASPKAAVSPKRCPTPKKAAAVASPKMWKNEALNSGQKSDDLDLVPISTSCARSPKRRAPSAKKDTVASPAPSPKRAPKSPTPKRVPKSPTPTRAPKSATPKLAPSPKRPAPTSPAPSPKRQRSSGSPTAVASPSRKTAVPSPSRKSAVASPRRVSFKAAEVVRAANSQADKPDKPDTPEELERKQAECEELAGQPTSKTKAEWARFTRTLEVGDKRAEGDRRGARKEKVPDHIAAKMTDIRVKKLWFAKWLVNGESWARCMVYESVTQEKIDDTSKTHAWLTRSQAIDLYKCDIIGNAVCDAAQQRPKKWRKHKEVPWLKQATQFNLFIAEEQRAALVTIQHKRVEFTAEANNEDGRDIAIKMAAPPPVAIHDDRSEPSSPEDRDDGGGVYSPRSRGEVQRGEAHSPRSRGEHRDMRREVGSPRAEKPRKEKTTAQSPGRNTHSPSRKSRGDKPTEKSPARSPRKENPVQPKEAPNTAFQKRFERRQEETTRRIEELKKKQEEQIRNQAASKETKQQAAREKKEREEREKTTPQGKARDWLRGVQKVLGELEDAKLKAKDMGEPSHWLTKRRSPSSRMISNP